MKKLLSFFLSFLIVFNIIVPNLTVSADIVDGGNLQTQQSNINVFVDKEIVRVGQAEEVTITVKDGDNPVVNEYVELSGAGIYSYGRTNEQGQLKVTVNAESVGAIHIGLGENLWDYDGYYYDEKEYYNDKLFAIDDEYAFVDISLKDKEGNFVDFAWTVTFENGEGGDPLDYTTNRVRTIMPKGKTTLALASPQGIYLLKELNLDGGKPYKFEYNAAEEKEVAFKVNYMNQPFSNASTFMSRKGKMFMGMTDENGERRMYLSPGEYHFTTYKQENGKTFILDKIVNVDDTTAEVVLNFDEINTGKLSYDLANGFGVFGIEINGQLLTLEEIVNNSEVVLPSGENSINFLAVKNNENTIYNFYPNEGGSKITINPGETLNNIDLQEKSVEFEANVSEDSSYGFNLYGGIKLINNSNLVLGGIEPWEKNLASFYIQTPNGEKLYIGQRDFSTYNFTLPYNLESGTYKLIAKMDFGSLYGVKTIEKEIIIPETTKVSVDKRIIELGQDNEVTVTVTNGQQPVANQEVNIYGAGVNVTGTTNNEGKLVVNLRPEYLDYLEIYVGSNVYREQIFAIDNYHALVETTLKDENGNYVDNFNLIGRRSETFFKKIYVIEEGEQILTARLDGDDFRYLVTKKVTLEGGKEYNIEFNASETREVTFNVNYMSEPLKNAGIYVLGKHFRYEEFMGTTGESGKKKIFISPDTYKIIIKKENDMTLNFVKEVTIDDTTSEINLNFDETNLGRLTLGNIGEVENLYLRLNDLDFYSNRNEIILTEGEYKVNRVSFNKIIDNNWVEYSFYPVSDFTQIVTAGQVEAIDLAEKEVQININNNEIHAGEYLSGSIALITNNNLMIDGCSGLHINYSLVNSNGQTIYSDTNDGTWFNFNLPEDLQSGTYKLVADAYFGPIYGGRHIEKEIQIIGKATIEVDKRIVKVGEETQVTLTVKEGENAAVNKKVRLNGAGVDVVGYTNEEGKFTATIKPEWSNSIYVEVEDRYYGSKIYALNENQSLVNVTLKDVGGNNIRYFQAAIPNVYGYSEWSNGNEVATVIATEGKNKVIVSSSEGYYLIKEIDVVAGQEYNVEFNGLEAKKVTVKASYMGDALRNSDIYLKNINNGWYNHCGWTGDSNEKDVYLTPGEYDILIRNSEKGVNLLAHAEINQETDVLDLKFDETNTAKIKLNVSGYNFNSYEMETNNYQHLMSNNGEYLVNVGQYRVNYIWLMNSENQSIGDIDIQPNNPIEINLNAGETKEINVDLTNVKEEITINEQELRAGEWISGEVKLIIDEAYKLNGWSNTDNKPVQYSLIKPNGDKIELGTNDGTWFNFNLPEDLQSGTYKLVADAYFGPIYGERHIEKEIYIEGNVPIESHQVYGRVYLPNEDGTNSGNLALDGKIYIIKQPTTWESFKTEYSLNRGIFTIDNLDDGKYIVYALPPSSDSPYTKSLSKEIEIKDGKLVGENNLEFVLTNPQFKVQVKDKYNNVITDYFNLQVRKENEPDLYGYWFDPVFDVEQVINVGGLEPGTYEIQAIRYLETGYNSSNVAKITIDEQGKIAGQDTVVLTANYGEFEYLNGTLEDKKVKLDWNDVDNAQKYHVYRAVEGEDFVKIATVTVSEYVDETVEEGKKYTYKVTAENSLGEGDAVREVVVEVPQQQEVINYGDVDEDGQITSSDYIKIKAYILGNAEFTDKQLKVADVDGDGVVSSSDYLQIKMFILGKISKFPVQQ